MNGVTTSNRKPSGVNTFFLVASIPVIPLISRFNRGRGDELVGELAEFYAGRGTLQASARKAAKSHVASAKYFEQIKRLKAAAEQRVLAARQFKFVAGAYKNYQDYAGAGEFHGRAAEQLALAALDYLKAENHETATTQLSNSLNQFHIAASNYKRGNDYFGGKNLLERAVKLLLLAARFYSAGSETASLLLEQAAEMSSAADRMGLHAAESFLRPRNHNP